MTTSRPFRIGLTADFYDATGTPRYRDIGLDVLSNEPRVDVQQFTEHRAEIGSDQLAGLQGAIVLTPRVTAQSLAASDDLLAIARFGVGFDTVDVAACTAADVLLLITAGAVDHSVAEATVGWMFALTHHFRMKDRLVREGRWDERSAYMGCELRGRRLGVVGFGGIGRAVIRLTSGMGMQPPLVFDPFASVADVSQSGGELVPLDRLLAEADFVSLHCPLNEGTRGLIGRRELALMKPGSYLINTARGGIVDEAALFEALQSRQIAGAALDCFLDEPLRSPPALAALDNVLLAPHCIAWTDELFREIGRTACRGLLEVANRRLPRGIVNPEVLDRPGFQAKWKRLTEPTR